MTQSITTSSGGGAGRCRGGAAKRRGRVVVVVTDPPPDSWTSPPAQCGLRAARSYVVVMKYGRNVGRIIILREGGGGCWKDRTRVTPRRQRAPPDARGNLLPFRDRAGACRCDGVGLGGPGRRRENGGPRGCCSVAFPRVKACSPAVLVCCGLGPQPLSVRRISRISSLLQPEPALAISSTASTPSRSSSSLARFSPLSRSPGEDIGRHRAASGVSRA